MLGGRAILHARCHACGANLLAEVLEYEQEVLREQRERNDEERLKEPPTGEFDPDLDEAVAAEINESASA